MGYNNRLLENNPTPTFNNAESYPEKTYLGKNQDNEMTYMEKPKWTCNWYWSFGHLVSKSIFTHFDSINRDKNLYDAIQEYFGDTFIIKDNDLLWQFCDVVKTIYKLKDAAELFYLGNANYSSKPLTTDIIQNKDYYYNINFNLIPQCIEKLYYIIEQQKKLNKKKK